MSFINSILTSLFGFYDTLFMPILQLGPYVALGFFSATLAVLFSLIYKVLLDVEKQQQIKDKISDHQDKMKEARKENKEDEASEHMKKTLELNQKMMMLNIKPMIATMVFVALIFPWLGATFAPSVQLNDQQNGTYTGNFSYGSGNIPVKVQNNSEVKISVGEQKVSVGDKVNFQGIEWDVKRFGESQGWFSGSDGKVLKLNGEFIELPFSIPLAGSALNWLGFYIIIVMPLTIVIRKMLGIS